MIITYFAYGSNLCERRLQGRVPSASFVGVAHLRGFQLRWHKRSNTDGSGKCSILETGDLDHLVRGGLFTFARDEEWRLDRAEGLGHGYAKHRIAVETVDGGVDAMTYIAQPSHVEAGLRPFVWYRDLVVVGARSCGLPKRYVAQLAAVEAEVDPDQGRAARHRAAIPCRGRP